FLSWERVPKGQAAEARVWQTAPDLAVEVLSESNTSAEIDRKLRELFFAGCRLAWVIDPRARSAAVYTAPDEVTRIDESGTLDGGKVLPGFRLPLAELFAEAEEGQPN